MPAFHVEWEAVDGEGLLHRYVSHDMPRSDADAMAGMLRGTAAEAVEVLPSDAPAPGG